MTLSLTRPSRFVLASLGVVATLAGATLGQEDAVIGANEVDTSIDFAPEIWTAPDPSLLTVTGRCLAQDELYRLVVEYQTDGMARYRALLVYAEPSHRLLMVQWNGEPSFLERRSVLEKPLSSFEEDSQRRHATFRFRPGRDQRILVQAITAWGERVDVLAGRVPDLCDFAVENRVHD